MAYAQWLSSIIQDRGPGRQKPEEGAHTCIHLLNAKPRLRTVRLLTCPAATKLTILRAQVRRIPAHFEPILVPIHAHSLNRGSNDARTRTAIVDHGNSGGLVLATVRRRLRP
jgi:hypothetical protein